MKMFPARLRPAHRRSGAFTLTELMMSIGMFALCGGMVYETFTASVYLMAKNSSLNKSNADLQQSYYRLLSTLESAALFVDCANYDPTAKTFTAVAAGTWGNSVRFMTQLPVSGWIVPDGGNPNGYDQDSNPPPPTHNASLSSSDQSVTVYYNAASVPPSLTVPASARFYPEFPRVSETISTGSSPGVKPGLGISSLQYNPSNVPPAVTIQLNNPLGSNTFLDCNRAYLIVEGAFAVVQTAAGPRQLLYFADTSQTANPVVICQDLDNSSQTQANDPTIPNGGTTGTFCNPAGSNAVQTLLPIRAPEYTNVMAKSGGATSSNNTWINVNTKFRRRINL